MKVSSQVKKKVLAVGVCCMALCAALMLAACSGGSGAPSEDYTKNFVGEWELVGMTEDGVETPDEDLELMKSFGMNITLTLSDDKKASFDFMGEATEGTWEAKSASEIELSMEGEKIPLTLSHDELEMVGDEASMTFKRMANS